MKDLFIRSALFFFALYSVCTLFYPPPPLRSSPCLRGTVCWRDVYVDTHFAHLRQGLHFCVAIMFSLNTHFVTLRQGVYFCMATMFSLTTHFVHLRQGDKVNGGPKATGAKGQHPKGVTSMAKVDVLMCT